MKSKLILFFICLLGTTGVIAQPNSSTGYYLMLMPNQNIVEVSNGCTLQLSEGTFFEIYNNYGDGWGGFGASLDVPFIGEERTFGVGGIGFDITQDGYYVFTLTNKGEGNWFVSILRSLVKHGNIAAIPDQTFTGSAIEPEIIVTDGENTLTIGTDYTVSYSDNTNVGTAKATITGIGNYSGTVEKTFSINAKALTAANVSDIAVQTYTGSAITPEITVTDGENTLTLGTDYTVSYSDNINAGTATAKITGKGNYSGTVEKTFTILPGTTVSAQADPYNSGTYYATFYDSTASYVADCEVYYVTANADGKFTLVKAEGNIVKAGEGVILKATRETVTLSPTNTSASYDSLLAGSDSDTTVTNALVLSLGENGVQFYKYSGSVGAHKAYIEQ